MFFSGAVVRRRRELDSYGFSLWLPLLSCKPWIRWEVMMTSGRVLAMGVVCSYAAIAAPRLRFG